MEKLVITVAPTNTKWFKKDNPFMPETPEEIAEDVIKAYHEGAVVAHIHARDDLGQETFETKYFRKIVERIRTETDMIIQLSTAGAAVPFKEKLIPIGELKSDMASLNIRGSDQEIEYNAKFMKDNGITPIIEAFDLGMIKKANRLIEEGIIEQPAHFELVFDLESVPGKSFMEDAEEMINRIKAMWPGSIWSRNRGAHNQFQLDAMTIILGGHIRVGLEDNLFISPGQMAKGSYQFVIRTRKLCNALDRQVASVEEARKLFQPIP
ncbi:MAG: 3-keto-5-aminohexanoate cleavage protein [Deltaproteobacteria bacterium]|nr:3-keto-5-aminohexanoate cleavage protein [Deltaproteobacteria bacterium]MBW2150338.1 3-keto-5-aminohexanoate cleavage protein [Deltaproteobacteria bacterium]